MRYSQINWKPLREARIGIRKHGIDLFEKAYHDLYREAIDEKNYLKFSEVRLLPHLLNGSYTNYFIETPNLLNLLRSMNIKEMALGDAYERIKERIPDATTTFVLEEDNSIVKASLKYRIGAVHLPAEERSIMFSLSYVFDRAGSIEQSLFVSDGDDVGALKLEQVHTANTLWHHKSVGPMLRTVVNMLLYIHAYPGSVQSGIPSNCIQAYPNLSHQSIRLSCHPSLLAEDGVTIAPHYRNAHFRHYPDDPELWPNAHGKTILIAGVFVRGNAITVNEVHEEKGGLI